MNHLFQCHMNDDGSESRHILPDQRLPSSPPWFTTAWAVWNHRRCRMHRQVGKGHPWSLRGRWGCWRHSRQQPFGWQLAVGLRGLWPCGWQGSLQVHLRKGWEVQAMPCAHWAQGTHEVSSGHYQLLMAVASQLTKADQKSHDRRRF